MGQGWWEYWGLCNVQQVVSIMKLGKTSTLGSLWMPVFTRYWRVGWGGAVVSRSEKINSWINCSSGNEGVGHQEIQEMLWKYNWHGLVRFRAQMTEMVVTVFKTCKYRSNSQLQWRKGKELCLSVDKQGTGVVQASLSGLWDVQEATGISERC